MAGALLAEDDGTPLLLVFIPSPLGDDADDGGGSAMIESTLCDVETQVETHKERDTTN